MFHENLNRSISTNNNHCVIFDVDENITQKTLIGAVIFTAACTMVVTTLVCIAVLHAITRRGCACLARRKTTGAVTLDSFAATDAEKREYVQITENFTNESPRSSSTFVTTSDSQPHSDCTYLQTSSSESGSSKENRDGSYDGRHSSGVCSMNSSTSSLASTTNHRNTFPFSNTKTYLYQGTEASLYDVSNDVSSSCGPPTPRQSLQLKCNEQYFPARRKHISSRDKPSRSRERHVNKRRKTAEQERLHIDKPEGERTPVATDEYRANSEGTVL